MLFNIIGNKGGIGKTTISAYIAEYLINKNREVLCIDTDPENRSFLSYRKLNVIEIQLKDETNNINKSAFDEMIDLILENKDKDIVIDNGAGSFNPLINYLAENDILELFEDENIENLIVSIVAGGGNTVDSVNGLSTLLDNFDTEFIIFNNQLLGSSQYKNKELSELQIVKKEKVKAIIEIPKLDEYQTNDIVDFTKYRKLFSDLKNDENLKMMQKRRLMKYRDEIFNQLEQCLKV